jgi:hypothetical protein
MSGRWLNRNVAGMCGTSLCARLSAGSRAVPTPSPVSSNWARAGIRTASVTARDCHAWALPLGYRFGVASRGGFIAPARVSAAGSLGALPAHLPDLANSRTAGGGVHDFAGVGEARCVPTATALLGIDPQPAGGSRASAARHRFVRLARFRSYAAGVNCRATAHPRPRRARRSHGKSQASGSATASER